jgi:hypothetical protein
MTTQSGYRFWNSSYSGSPAVGTNGVYRIIPSGAQMGFAGELRLPISDFDVTAEFVDVKNNTRETPDGIPTSTLRRGDLHGYSYYVELGYWPLGNRDVNGLPGYENPAHLDFSKKASPPKQALQLVVKWEQLAATYDSKSRAGTADPKGIDGDIKVNAVSLGANFWATKHLRFTANYILDWFPDSVPGGNTAQRATAPGNTLKAGINDDGRTTHVLHELAFRAAVAF